MTAKLSAIYNKQITSRNKTLTKSMESHGIFSHAATKSPSTERAILSLPPPNRKGRPAVSRPRPDPGACVAGSRDRVTPLRGIRYTPIIQLSCTNKNRRFNNILGTITKRNKFIDNNRFYKIDHKYINKPIRNRHANGATSSGRPRKL